MFKLVVLCALLAAAVAEPSGAYFAQPLTYSSTVISPAVTTISKQASSVIHPSPSFYYSAPTAYTHFIKKRSAPFIYPTTYAAGSPFLATTYNAPLVTGVLPGAHVLSTPIATPIAATPIAATPIATHLIKKRSAQFPALSYAAYKPLTYAAPLFPSTNILPTTYFSSPVISHGPLTYTHLIKKRSAPLAFTTPYIAPAAITHQSRIDLTHTPLVTSYSSPLAYSTPIGYSHIF